MGLEDYRSKRKFSQTPEPKGEIKAHSSHEPLRFVVQLHRASHLHFDFRIEADGVFKSWAVPKGPSMNSQDMRLAVLVEDHPLEYGSFEGIIPKGNYGAGTVMIWDEGTYLERHSTTRAESEGLILKGIENGHITVVLEGKRLKGEFALVRTKRGMTRGDRKSWLMVKKRDQYSSRKVLTPEDDKEVVSVKTGRTMEEITAQSPAKNDVWISRAKNSIRNSTGSSDRTKSSKKNSPDLYKVAEPRKIEQPVQKPPQSLAPTKKKFKPSPEKLPRRNKPMLATPAPSNQPFSQQGWLFEIDHGGVRAIAELERGIVHLYSKQLLPFERKFPTIVEALRQVQTSAQSNIKTSAVLDGEITGAGVGEGSGENEEPVFWVRDLLHLDGFNLRTLPLIERKKRLEKLEIFSKTIRYCPHKHQDGEEFFRSAQAQRSPAILARDAYSPYIAGTSKHWLRIPASTQRDHAPVPRLTHLSKIYFPKDRFTKGDLIEYYRSVAPFLLPHLYYRPQSLHRFPGGIESEGFYHKNLIEHHPRWAKTHRIHSESGGKSIEYLVCQNEPTLLYMANLGCIEINPWLSRVGSLDRPDAIVIDLDPDDNSFSEVITVAKEVHRVLDAIGAAHACKTSGKSGIHIFIPVQARYDYETARNFALSVCQVIHQNCPKLTSLERNPAKRRHKIYLDCYQNARGQTLASVYSVRPVPGAPVSTPVLWKELTPKFHFEQFTIRNVLARIEKLGDLWKPILEEKVDLESCLSRLSKKFPISR